MKSSSRLTTAGFFTGLAGFVVAVAMLTLTGPGAAFAANNTTSAGATIHNYVSVYYTSGTTSVTTYAAVDVKVLPVFANPTITTPANQLVTAGAAVSYTTTITTNSNGQDTLDLSQTITPTGMGGVTPTPTFAPASPITLWGGLAVSVASQNVINLPGASLTGTAFLTEISGTTKPTVMIGNKQYTVIKATTGNIASTILTTGVTTPETYDTITVSPVDGSSNISSLTAGTQILEYKTVTYSFTAGTPSVAGTDGYYDSTITATSSDTTKSATTTSFRTTVQSPNLTITKLCWVTPTSTWPGTLTTSNYTASCSAQPGQTIEYLITLTNANSNATSVASSVKVQDPVTYAYTTYVGSSTYAGNGTATLSKLSDASGVSPLVAGYTFTSPIAGGSATANMTNQAFIVYRVTVN